MALVKTMRQGAEQFIGLLAATFDFSGIDASNNRFNDRKINRYYYTNLLMDNMIIKRFYVYETLIRHSFVVFQTNTGHTFKIHLIADVFPGKCQPIQVLIVPTYWKPKGKRIRRSNKTGCQLKHFVTYAVKKFGRYEVGFNDCRHFARAVAAFLAS